MRDGEKTITLHLDTFVVFFKQLLFALENEGPTFISWRSLAFDMKDLISEALFLYSFLILHTHVTDVLYMITFHIFRQFYKDHIVHICLIQFSCYDYLCLQVQTFSKKQNTKKQ